MKKKLILVILLSSILHTYSQNLTCKDFHSGTFIIPADSLVQETYTVVRKNNQQIEYDKEGHKIIVDINFIDECTYIMKANPNSEKFDALAKYINDSGGIKVSVLKIKNDTLFYSGLLENDSIRYEQPGVMIKLK